MLGSGSVPALTYTPGTLKDLPGNLVAGTGAIASTDKALPVILSVETADLNGSGSIDALRVTFSEPVSDATVSAAEFAIGGAGGLAFSSTTNGDVADDATIYISFTDGAQGTAATPTLTYTAGALADMPGNLMAGTAALPSTDKAPPVILGADATLGFDQVMVTFSEPVSSSAVSAQPLAAGDFLYGNGGAGGATGIIGMGPDADGSDGQVRVLLDASFAPGDSSLDSVAAAAAKIFDAAGNAALTAAALIASAGDIVPPVVASTVTRDTNGDGFIDRIEVTFSEPVDAASVVTGRWHVSKGTISGVADGLTPLDPVIWVNLVDDVLGTDAVPTLTLNPGAARDPAGNGNDAATAVPLDGAPPVILVSLAVTGEKTIALKFSEPVSGLSAALGAADFTYSDGGNPIAYCSPIDLAGILSREIFITLTGALSPADVLLPRTVAAEAASVPTVRDAAGNLMGTAAHRVTDIYLGLVEPVWATDGGVGPALKTFDGRGRLGDSSITLQANNGTGSAATLLYDVNVPASSRQGGLWLPQWVAGLVSTANAGAKSLGAAVTVPPLDTFQIPGSDVKSGDRFEFLFEVGGVYAARVVNRKDPRTVAPWSFAVQDTAPQRGSVTITNNVISPRFQDTATIFYSLRERGSVTIIVSDISGNVVSVLQRGVQDPGDRSVSWDGKNRGGRSVAPGLYFVRVVGPGFDEVRKVLVIN